MEQLYKNGQLNPLDDEQSMSVEQLNKILAQRARELSKVPVKEEVGQTINLLVFRLHSERYGIEVINVREIYPLEQLTPVPRTPNFMAGVFSARGRILSVVDLYAFLGMSPLTRTENTKIIVVTNTNPNSPMANMEIGILADHVEDVLTIYKDDIEPTLLTRRRTTADYIQGITKDLLEVLDLNELLDDPQLIVNEEPQTI